MKSYKTQIFVFGLSLLASVSALGQGGDYTAGELLTSSTKLADAENTPVLVHPVPHPRQVKWMRTEFYAFFHYGMDTFTGEEWGDGSENPNTYNPTEQPNPEQWLQTAKNGHMKGGIAVVKHHDGFCLWPTQTTNHCISSSCGTYAKTDIPAAFAAAANKLGMKYGFYISPWDRNSQYYGDGSDKYVNEVFLRQCKELAAYGSDQFEMWFDGANGGSGYYGGAGGSRSIDRATYYDVPNLRYMVHQMSPDCILWGVGGEARWIGNESGWAGQTNWCTANRVEGSDVSNAAYGHENGWMWLPGESDAKSSGGWFWSPSKNSYTSSEGLFAMYLKTVGRNATLILNLPPTTNGKLHDNLVTQINGLGNLLTQRLGTNLASAASGATIESATASRANGQTVTYNASNVLDGNEETYYATDDNTNTCTITVKLPATKVIHYVMMQEHIALGQRVKAFNLQYSTDGSTWNTFGQGEEFTTIGYKRIIPWNGTADSYGAAGVQARYVRLNITDSKACPCIENIEIF